MNFIYRGQSYIASNTTAPVNPQTTFTYRGQSYQRAASIAVTPKAKLVYRGVPYVQPESTTIPSFSPAFS